MAQNLQLTHACESRLDGGRRRSVRCSCEEDIQSYGSPNKVAVHDVGAACATLSLQATALGLHTHGMAGFDEQVLRDSFGIPADFDPISCWTFGYLGDPETLGENYRKSELQPRTRKPVEAFLFKEWEQTLKL